MGYSGELGGGGMLLVVIIICITIGGAVYTIYSEQKSDYESCIFKCPFYSYDGGRECKQECVVLTDCVSIESFEQRIAGGR